ncbi:MAG: 4'-phosphopantetheinyl transferase family protein [Flavobacteriales bacterium]
MGEPNKRLHKTILLACFATLAANLPRIHFHNESSDQPALALWHIVEATSALQELAMLAEKDFAILDSIKLEKRKREWLSVRLLLNEFALGKLLRFLPNGKPILEGNMHISISHSGDLGAIILHHENIGLDIQTLDERILRIERKFVNSDEQNFIYEMNEKATCLTMIWCVKEAVFKYFGQEVDFSQDIRVHSFQTTDSTLHATYQGKHGHYHFHLKHFMVNNCHVVHTSEVHQVS